MARGASSRMPPARSASLRFRRAWASLAGLRTGPLRLRRVGIPDGSQLTDEQWAEFEDAMLPLEARAEEIYERIYSALPQ